MSSDSEFSVVGVFIVSVAIAPESERIKILSAITFFLSEI